MKLATKAIHVGQRPDKETGAVIPPIYQTSTYQQKAPGDLIGPYDYTRAGNPNFTNLEETLASLEDAKFATVFASGLSAITAWILEAGPCHVVVNEDVYGGTYRVLTQVFKKFGVEASFVKGADLKSWEAAITPKTRWFFAETPTNPLLSVVDLKNLSALARSKDIRLIVDSTFATPCLQQPLKMGADLIIHSTTKYIGGHSDLIGGVLITNNPKLKEQYDFFRKAVGLNPAPHDCWLTSRGVKTLAVRMEQHQKNAKAVAKALQGHAAAETVFYPGFGGMVSVRFKKKAQALAFIKGLKLFTLAESLGGVESLVCLPSIMTHASIPEKEREARGVTDSLVRLSVGIEETEDLVDDIRTALKEI